MGFVIVLGFMGLLYFGAMIAPGVGLSGRLMIQMPVNLLDWAHAPGYGLLAVLITRGLQRRGWTLVQALTVGATIAFLFGLFTELSQRSVPGRQSSFDDLILNGIGIGFAVLFMLAYGFQQRVQTSQAIDAPTTHLPSLPEHATSMMFEPAECASMSVSVTSMSDNSDVFQTGDQTAVHQHQSMGWVAILNTEGSENAASLPETTSPVYGRGDMVADGRTLHPHDHSPMPAPVPR